MVQEKEHVPEQKTYVIHVHCLSNNAKLTFFAPQILSPVRTALDYEINLNNKVARHHCIYCVYDNFTTRYPQ